MAFCRNCGKQLSDDAAFCANCGTPVVAAQNNAQQAAPQQGYAQPTAPVQPQFVSGDADAQENKVIAWLAYLGLLLLIPLFVKKNSEYCKYHVKQGATLFCCELAYSIVYAIIMAIIHAIFDTRILFGLTVHSPVCAIFSIIFGLASIFFVVMIVIGIVNAATGKKNELPLLGKIPFIAMLMDKIYAALNK